MRGLISTLVVLVATACTAESEPLEPGCDAPLLSTRLAPENTNKLDLLFMIDTSADMSSEQAVFAQALPDFVRELTAASSISANDIHVGFITADLGTGGHLIPTCEEPVFGDDALLHLTTLAPCGDLIAPSDVPFLSFREDSNSEELSADMMCLTNGNDDGCGIEQPLDAILKALTPTSSPLRFADESTGHGSVTNDGFLRPGAVLAVILLANEDDCSIRDAELFDRNSLVYTEPDLSARCLLYEDGLHPIQRYVDGLLALRTPE
ncbi:MAG: hypothetical protein ACI9KE_003817, partial [Polyangiales bacterium]